MGFKKTLKKIIKSIDIFGRPIMLNYDKKGQHFNTTLGGVISIILNLAVIAYGIERFIVLF